MVFFLQLAQRYLTYRLAAVDQYKIHSPFVFELYNSIILSKPEIPQFEAIEKRRMQLENDPTIITVTDYGAGSKWQKSNERVVGTIAKSSKKAQKWQLLLFQLIKKYYSNARILELGTSFGITTSYLAKANPANEIITFEGCPSIARIASATFQKVGTTSVKIAIGNIDETLPAYLQTIPKVDVVFFDANHRFEPTLRYFEQCLAKATEESCFIFDDIYWSDEMQAAWEHIKKHEAVTLSLDFFQIGIVFFRKKQPKQHFVLKA